MKTETILRVIEIWEEMDCRTVMKTFQQNNADNAETYCSENSQSDLEFCMGNAEDVTCRNEGYDDGQGHPFSQDIYAKCGDKYYDAFIEGCVNAGNLRDICKTFTYAS
jgi:hypothetical protein